MRVLALTAALALCLLWVDKAAAVNPQLLFRQYCAQCHGVERLGGTGPALLPENLGRLPREQAGQVIAHGLSATQMPGFGDRLQAEDIAALVDYIYSPLERAPRWGESEIRASRLVYSQQALASEPDQVAPVYDADPLNLFLVVEAGDHHITVLDGDRLEPIRRFKTRRALHGGLKYSSTGRYVYLCSRDGWVGKFDMYSLEMIAEIRVGINTRNAAVSADDRYVMVGNYLPHSLVILDARDLSLVKIIPVADSTGKSSRVSAVYTAAPRGSFIVALKDVKEVWEIKYTDVTGLVRRGPAHERRLENGMAAAQAFPLRRIPLTDYLDDFFFDQDYEHLIGAARKARKGQVITLTAGRKVADIAIAGMPHLGSGVTWDYKNTRVLASPDLETGTVSIIDMRTWKVIKRLATKGPGFFMRSHERSPYAWVDVFRGPHRDLMYVIDKQTLEIARVLRPEPGRTSGHVEFTRDGSKALVSIWEPDGAVIAYDAKTLQEIKRIPMRKPVGKYNVYNKIMRSEGTSH